MRLLTWLAPAPTHSRGTVPPVRAAATLLAPDAGLAHWGSLHDAWQDAADARAGGALPGREPLPIGVVIAIVEHRVRAVRGLHDALGQELGLRQRIDALQPHARDAQGRNWNIPALARGTLPRASDEADFRRVVDALRDQFDLA
ncbi:MAG TPA: hypothetical protein PLO41_18250 [Rubrivivax sp.]|nr:hypothetical protein [Rubrivivax sp.]